MKTALDGVRILDLAGAEGQYCGRVLADLGAEVIKVEPPEGDPARRELPLMAGGSEGELGLGFVHFNTNKKSVVLDLDTPEGQSQFLRLASTADAIIETGMGPGGGPRGAGGDESGIGAGLDLGVRVGGAEQRVEGAEHRGICDGRDHVPVWVAGEGTSHRARTPASSPGVGVCGLRAAFGAEGSGRGMEKGRESRFPAKR